MYLDFRKYKIKEINYRQIGFQVILVDKLVQTDQNMIILFL